MHAYGALTHNFFTITLDDALMQDEADKGTTCLPDGAKLPKIVVGMSPWEEKRQKITFPLRGQAPRRALTKYQYHAYYHSFSGSL